MSITGGGVGESNVNIIVDGIVVNFTAEFVRIVTICGAMPTGVVGVEVTGNYGFVVQGKNLIKVSRDGVVWETTGIG